MHVFDKVHICLLKLLREEAAVGTSLLLLLADSFLIVSFHDAQSVGLHCLLLCSRKTTSNKKQCPSWTQW
jgi:hypothetical protein